MTYVKPSVALVVWFCMSKTKTRVPNGVLLLWKKMPQEAALVGPTSYSIHDKGLSTVISQVDRDAYGRKLPQSTRLQMWRLRKWQIRSRVHSSIDRNLAQAMSELDRLSGKVSVSRPIREKAAIIYRKALDKGLVRGRSISQSPPQRCMLLAAKVEHLEPSVKSLKQVLPAKKMLQDATECF